MFSEFKVRNNASSNLVEEQRQKYGGIYNVFKKLNWLDLKMWQSSVGKKDCKSSCSDAELKIFLKQKSSYFQCAGR